LHLLHLDLPLASPLKEISLNFLNKPLYAYEFQLQVHRLKGEATCKNMLILLLLPEVANRERTNSYSDNAQQNNKYQPKNFYIGAYMMQGFPDWDFLPRPVIRCNTGRLVL
jgi:hypothetical protein